MLILFAVTSAALLAASVVPGTAPSWEFALTLVATAAFAHQALAGPLVGRSVAAGWLVMPAASLLVHRLAGVPMGMQAAAFVGAAALLSATASAKLTWPSDAALQPPWVAWALVAIATALAAAGLQKFGMGLRPAEGLRLCAPLLAVALTWQRIGWPAPLACIAVFGASAKWGAGLGEGAVFSASLVAALWVLGRNGRNALLWLAAGLVVFAACAALARGDKDLRRFSAWATPVPTACDDASAGIHVRTDQTLVREMLLHGAVAARWKPQAAEKLKVRQVDDEVPVTLIACLGVVPTVLLLLALARLPAGLLRSKRAVGRAAGAALAVHWLLGLLTDVGVLPFTGSGMPILGHGTLALSAMAVLSAIAVAPVREDAPELLPDLQRPAVLRWLLPATVVVAFALVAHRAIGVDPHDRVLVCELMMPNRRIGKLAGAVPGPLLNTAGQQTTSELATWAGSQRQHRADRFDLAGAIAHPWRRFLRAEPIAPRPLQTTEVPSFQQAAVAVVAGLPDLAAALALDATTATVLGAASNRHGDLSNAIRGSFDIGSAGKVMAVAGAAGVGGVCNCSGRLSTPAGVVHCHHHGPMTVETTLARSCNVCAVQMATQHAAATARVADAIGLTFNPANPQRLVLGAATALPELARLYAAIAVGDGRVRKARYVTTDPVDEGRIAFLPSEVPAIAKGLRMALAPGGTCSALPTAIAGTTLEGAKSGTAMLAGRDRGTLVVLARMAGGRKVLFLLTAPVDSTAGRELSAQMRRFIACASGGVVGKATAKVAGP